MQSQRQIRCSLFALTTVSFANENGLYFCTFCIAELKDFPYLCTFFPHLSSSSISVPVKGKMMPRTEKTDLLLVVRGEKSILQFVRLIEQKSERENAVSTL